MFRAAIIGAGVSFVLAAFVLLAAAAASSADDARADPVPGSSLRFDASGSDGGVIPTHFVGLSIEWSLIERYMGPNARPAFAKLLRNLGSGELRIGGSSQDLMPFDASAPNTNRVITPEDLLAIRAALDAANVPAYDGADKRRHLPGWATILGTAMAPPNQERPWVSPRHARAFVTEGVLPDVRRWRSARDRGHRAWKRARHLLRRRPCALPH